MTTQRAPAPARGAVALTGLLLALTGCAGGADRGELLHTSESSAPAVAGAVLTQSRMDVDERKVRVRVENGPDALTVTDMVLTSSLFSGPMAYPRSPVALDGGRVVDLPVTLGEPVCGGAEGPGRHVVRVDYVRDGVAGTFELPPVDEGERVTALHAQECFVRAVEEVADLSISGLPEVVGDGGALVARVTVEVVPRGGEGGLTVVGVGGTPLLAQVAGGTAERLPQGSPIGRYVAASAEPSTFTFTVVPGRCDPHAVAEDKQGTRFPLVVEMDGAQGTVPLSAPPEVKVALYDFVRAACGP